MGACRNMVAHEEKNLKHNNPGLRFLRRLPWSKVFQIWKRQEAALPAWIRHYRKKGYGSWREWRKAGFRPLHPQRRTWYLYEINNPTRVIPRWCGGPFGGWRKIHYRGRSTASFAQLATDPKIRRHEKIRSILRRFPKNSLMIGAMVGRRLYVLEGMHRACAIAIASAQGKTMRPRITIALTRLRRPLPDLSHPRKNRSAA